MASLLPARSVLLPVLALAASCLIGCSVGKVQTLPLMRIDIQKRESLISSIEPPEGCYWQGDKGTLNIVLARRGYSLIDKTLGFTWVMSLVLEDMPAGRERLYRATPRTLRLCQSGGGDHRRAKSTTGVVVIERLAGERLKGRFHILVRQQQFTVLNGWGPPLYRAPTSIMVGEFVVACGETQGKRLFEQTEADGFDRIADEAALTQPSRRIYVPATSTAPH